MAEFSEAQVVKATQHGRCWLMGCRQIRGWCFAVMVSQAFGAA